MTIYFLKSKNFLNSETDLAILLSDKGLWTKIRRSLSCVIHKLCRKIENYVELGAKRTRFSVFPIYFVYLRYTLNLGGAQVLTARNWQSWDLKAVFNFSMLKLFLHFCVCTCVVCVETTLGASYSSTPNVLNRSIWDFFGPTFLLFEGLRDLPCLTPFSVAANPLIISWAPPSLGVE